MTSEHQTTPEEEAYERLLKEKGEMLSKTARIILEEAELAAYTEHLIHNVIFGPEGYDEAMEKMRLAAVELTGQDRELLAEVWRSALAAAASIDPDDKRPAGDRVDRGDVHRYYRMLSGMVERVLQDKKDAELREKFAEREPENPEDLPF